MSSSPGCTCFLQLEREIGIAFHENWAKMAIKNIESINDSNQSIIKTNISTQGVGLTNRGKGNARRAGRKMKELIKPF